MKLLVIGSTGRTGKHVLEQAIHRGHQVTAFTRRPDALAGVSGLSRIVEGDALKLEDLRKAVVGQDAVIAIVTPPDLKPTTVISDTTRQLITALKESQIRRLIITSARPMVATRPWLAIVLTWLVFRAPYSDLARAEGMLEVSGLDWSIVRATMLNDKPFSGQVHTDFEPDTTGGDWQLSRADFAMTLLNVAENPQMVGKAIGVNGARAHKAQRGIT